MGKTFVARQRLKSGGVKEHVILRKQVLFCRVKISAISKKARQSLHLLAVGLTFAVFP